MIDLLVLLVDTPLAMTPRMYVRAFPTSSAPPIKEIRSLAEAWAYARMTFLVHGVGDELAGGLGHLRARAPVPRGGKRVCVRDRKGATLGLGEVRLTSWTRRWS